jgi:predicted nucleotidyltransferase
MTDVFNVSDIKRRLTPLFVKHKPVRRVILFGSFAREQARGKSDLDLVVDTREEMLGLPLFGLAGEIGNELERRVDLFEACEIIPDTPLEKNIKREGIVIYERN